jgi:hypothetical protein
MKKLIKEILQKANPIISKIEEFIKRRKKTVSVTSLIIVIISATAVSYSSVSELVVIMAASSLLCVIGMLMYRIGHIPFLGRDTLWSLYRSKYSEEEADEKYKAHSLKAVTIFYPIAIISFLIWVIAEVVLLIIEQI